MTDLRGIQQAFQRYVMKDDNDVSVHVADSSGAFAEHRLATYYNAYRIRLIDALAMHYPVLQRYMGEDQFENLALAYLDTHPSINRSIRWFGGRLAQYLLAQSDLENSELLSEIATFEWARVSVFDEKDSPQVVTLNEMANLSVEQWPRLQFQFKPAIRLLNLEHNAPQLAKAIDDDEPLPAMQRTAKPLTWLVWRQHHNIRWRSFASYEAEAIESAIDGSCFSTICDDLLEWIEVDQVAMTAASLVKQWIEDQLITNLRQKE